MFSFEFVLVPLQIRKCFAWVGKNTIFSVFSYIIYDYEHLVIGEFPLKIIDTLWVWRNRPSKIRPFSTTSFGNLVIQTRLFHPQYHPHFLQAQWIGHALLETLTDQQCTPARFLMVTWIPRPRMGGDVAGEDVVLPSAPGWSITADDAMRLRVF